jgi:hypothetical protein
VQRSSPPTTRLVATRTHFLCPEKETILINLKHSFLSARKAKAFNHFVCSCLNIALNGARDRRW